MGGGFFLEIFAGLGVLSILFMMFFVPLFGPLIGGSAPADTRRFPKLHPLAGAYLVGGPLRALEMALFRVIRDGYARHDGKGYFASRVEEAPEELPQVERELLFALGMDAGLRAYSVFQLNLPGLKEVERGLIANGCVYGETYSSKLRLYSAVPLIVLFTCGIARVAYGHFYHSPIALLPQCVGLLGLISLIIASGTKTQRLTGLGQKLREMMIAKYQTRATLSTRPVSDRDWEPFNQIDDLEKMVLVGGLLALGGTAFAPLSSFSEVKYESAKPGLWGSNRTDKKGESHSE